MTRPTRIRMTTGVNAQANPLLSTLAAAALSALACGPTAAQTEAIASFGKWQVMESSLELSGETRCDIRTREIDSADDDTPPRLYLIGNGDPDHPFDIRLNSGDDTLAASAPTEATLTVDENTPIPAHANLLDPYRLSVTASIRELKLGGAVTITTPLADGEARSFTFSLIGFTAAYRKLANCNPAGDVPSLAIAE